MNKGIAVENRVAQIGRSLDYLVSGLRHEGGAGDQLWTPPRHRLDDIALLIEVKGTAEPPWRSTWGKQKRVELIARADYYNAEPILAWWPPKWPGVIWLTPDDWPRSG